MSPAGGLSERERRTLGAVCDAFMPRLEPRPGDDPALFQLSAKELGLADAVEQAISGDALSPARRTELRLFVRLLDVAPFMLLVTGIPSAFARMTPAQRETALLRLANHPLSPMRSGYQALKRLATFLAYSVTPDGRSNPAWRAIGYELPRETPRRAASVRTTPLSRLTELEADACVIGAGAGGAVVAERLARAGKRVIVLEGGPDDQAPEYDRREISAMQRLYLDQGTTATRDLSVALLAGQGLGGGTTVNWQTSLRLPDDVRNEWATRSGVEAFADERFTRALDVVCKRLSVGTAESWQNDNNAALARGCDALGYRVTTIPRNARGCDQSQCGYCVFGCSVGGKQTSAATFLADAQRSGDVTVVPNARAYSVGQDDGPPRAFVNRVRVMTADMRPLSIHAPTIVVAAGAIETPAVLLRSGITHPQIGRNLYLHPTSAVAGVYGDPIRGWLGAPQSVLCDELGSIEGHYGVRLETAPVHPGLIALAHPWHGGRAHRERMQRVGNASAIIALSRDRGSGRVGVDAQGRAVIDYRVGRLERSLLRRGIAAAARVHWAAGASEIHTLFTREHSLRRSASSSQRDIDAFCDAIESLSLAPNRCAVFSAHQMGTCRMGTDRHRDVCDERGEVYGVRGLYVADGSLFPASSGVNPMITIMALAHMVGDAIVAG